MDDTLIIELFLLRDEEAIRQCQEKYSPYCRFIISNVLSDEEDLKEVLSDVFLKAWNTIPSSPPKSLKSYLGMLCRQLSLNKIKEKQAKKRNSKFDLILDELEECIADPLSNDEMVDAIAFRESMNKFLAMLPVKSRRIFIARYWYSCSISQIAKEYSLKESNVTVLLTRIRKKLKEYLIKEGFNI